MGSATLSTHTDGWVRHLLFDRGYLASMKGESIKVYLTLLTACGGEPGRSVSMSLRSIQEATNLSCPTVIESLSRLEKLGLVVSTVRGSRKGNTYYIPGVPPEHEATT